MANRTRYPVTFTLDPELLRRLRAVADKLPGASMSGVVDATLEMHLPHFEAVAAAMDAPPDERERVAMENMAQSFVRTLMEGVEEQSEATKK